MLGAGSHVSSEDVIGMAVKILACSVVAHCGSRVRMAGSDLHVMKVDSGVEHRGHKRVPQHVRMHPRQTDTGISGQVLQPSGGGMAIHPHGAQVPQDGPDGSTRDRPLDRPLDRRRQWGEDDLATLTADLQHPMAVLLAHIGNVGATGFEDPQPEQAEHGHQAKSLTFADVRAALNNASNCRCDKPKVGDSVGTFGRRT